MTNFSSHELKRIAFETRKDILRMCCKAGTGHVTSSMSCVEILIGLYFAGILKHDPLNPNWIGRDRFILSKGQASPALYSVLARRGYFDPKWCDEFAQKYGKFGVHLQKDVPGAEITSGSLGQGFGIAVGMALAAKLSYKDYFVFTLLGDGELYEGSIWESALFAPHHKLNNLVGIIDRNYLCATDFTENFLSLEPLKNKWEAFGWNIICIDGHSIEELIHALDQIRSRKSIKPLMIIADTVKGHGVDSMLYTPLCHGIALTNDDEVKKAFYDVERGLYENR